ncbi:MAG: hypothetical protein WC612_05735 [Bdellovibrionales bacterium]|jgi:hypothetical protein
MSEFDPDQAKSSDFKHRGMAEAPIQTELVQAELSGGERLLWTGRPLAFRVFMSTLIIYLFAIPWTAFSLFWEAMAISLWFTKAGDKMPEGMGRAVMIVFPLFGLPFIAVGFFMLARPFIEGRRARKTIYAITDRRALVIRQGALREVASYSFDSSEFEISRKERADGSGSLFFASSQMVGKAGNSRLTKKGFEHIGDVRQVEEKLRSAIRAHEAAQA